MCYVYVFGNQIPEVLRISENVQNSQKVTINKTEIF